MGSAQALEFLWVHCPRGTFVQHGFYLLRFEQPGFPTDRIWRRPIVELETVLFEARPYGADSSLDSDGDSRVCAGVTTKLSKLGYVAPDNSTHFV